eukprot:jgi/Ulvmu1/3216/UM015_0257.1
MEACTFDAALAVAAAATTSTGTDVLRFGEIPLDASAVNMDNLQQVADHAEFGSGVADARLPSNQVTSSQEQLAEGHHKGQEGVSVAVEQQVPRMRSVDENIPCGQGHSAMSRQTIKDVPVGTDTNCTKGNIISSFDVDLPDCSQSLRAIPVVDASMSLASSARQQHDFAIGQDVVAPFSTRLAGPLPVSALRKPAQQQTQQDDVNANAGLSHDGIESAALQTTTRHHIPRLVDVRAKVKPKTDRRTSSRVVTTRRPLPMEWTTLQQRLSAGPKGAQTDGGALHCMG